MKLGQGQDVFVVDYGIVIKLCQAYLFSHFVDLNTSLKSDIFYSIKSMVNSSHDLFIMKWILDLNTNMKHLTFDCNGQHILAKHVDQLTWVMSFVTKYMRI
jgi:hypothetical protein